MIYLIGMVMMIFIFFNTRLFQFFYLGVLQEGSHLSNSHFIKSYQPFRLWYCWCSSMALILSRLIKTTSCSKVASSLMLPVAFGLPERHSAAVLPNKAIEHICFGSVYNSSLLFGNLRRHQVFFNSIRMYPRIYF